MITVLCVPGTTESWQGDTRTQVSGMLKHVVDALPAQHFTARWIGYPADYGLRMSYTESVTAGELAVRDALLAVDGPVVLLGYSQGAAIAGNVAELVHRWPEWGIDLRGVGLVSDPRRHRHQYAPHPPLYRPAGYGVSGERLIPTDRFPVWSVSAAGDPISSLPEGNPLRTVADWTNFMCVSRPRQWVADIIADIRQRQMQRWWDTAKWKSWAGALAYARGMVLDGRHTCYPVEPMPGTSLTYTQALAQAIAAHARKEPSWSR